MPAIQIPDDTYQVLSHRAIAMGTTVDALARPALERLTLDSPPDPTTDAPEELPLDQWNLVFERLLTNARGRANRYPTGFQADVSRESIYEGRGE